MTMFAKNKIELSALYQFLSNAPEEKRQFDFEIEERAGIIEFDGNRSRLAAQILAKAEVEETWRRKLFAIENQTKI